MKKLIESELENLSTEESFRFRICCAVCGKEYANRTTHFSKAGHEPQTQEKRILYHAIYQQEFHIARHSAIEKATEDVNYCPICKRLVCNRCFLICDDLDMCQSCADKLQESGTPVSDATLESVM